MRLSKIVVLISLFACSGDDSKVDTVDDTLVDTTEDTVDTPDTDVDTVDTDEDTVDTDPVDTDEDTVDTDPGDTDDTVDSDPGDTDDSADTGDTDDTIVVVPPDSGDTDVDTDAVLTTTIYDIKQDPSLMNMPVTVDGVVSGVEGTQFFLQVALEDHGATGVEYSGIFVYIPATNPAGLNLPLRGDKIRISGTVDQFFGQTQLSDITDIQPAPGGATLPAPELAAPADIATSGTRAVPLDSVLVRVEDVVVQSVQPPASAGDRDPTNELIVDGDLRINDYFHLITPFPEVGWELDVTGVLRFANNNFKVEPRDDADVQVALVLSDLQPSLVFVDEGASAPSNPLVASFSAPVPAGTQLSLSANSANISVAPTLDVPTGATEVEIPVAGVTASSTLAEVEVTLGGSSMTAMVRVVGPTEQPTPESSEPSDVVLLLNYTTDVEVTFDLPGRPGGTLASLSTTAGSGVGVGTTVSLDEGDLTTIVPMFGAAEGSGTVTVSTASGSLQIPVTVIDAAPHPILTEVFYNVAGADDGYEWIEIYNGTPGPVDLSEYTFASGGSSYTTSTFELSGTIPVGGCWVIGGPSSSVDNGSPVYDLVADFSPDLQNSGSTADAYALFNLPEADIDATQVPVDAVIVGVTNSNGLLDELGQTTVDLGAVAEGSSVWRSTIGWTEQAAPSPGDCSHAQ